MPFQSAGNSMYFKDPYMSFKTYIISIAIGAFTGGVINGTIAAFNNKNFWTGDNVLNGNVFSFRNTPSNAVNSSADVDFWKILLQKAQLLLLPLIFKIHKSQSKNIISQQIKIKHSHLNLRK